MLKLGISTPPNVKDAALVADILDSIGEIETANLFDEYIKLASATTDIVKISSFWGNVWKRMKGKLKTVFIDEYKELYQSAKEVQKKVEDRIENLKKQKKQLQQDFKNYELATWRRRLERMDGLNARDILMPFDRAYGKFLSYVTQFEDTKEEDLDKMSPSEKLVTPSESKKMETIREVDKIRWFQPYSLESIYMSANRNIAKIAKSRIDKYFQYMNFNEGNKIMSVKEGAKYRVLGRIFGDDEWEEFFEDKEYIYYKKIFKLEKKKEIPVMGDEYEEITPPPIPAGKPVGKTPAKKPAEKTPAQKVVKEIEEEITPEVKKEEVKVAPKEEEVPVAEEEREIAKTPSVEKMKERKPSTKTTDVNKEVEELLGEPEVSEPTVEQTLGTKPRQKGGPRATRKGKPMVAGEKPSGEDLVWVKVLSGEDLKKANSVGKTPYRQMKRSSVKPNSHLIVEDEAKIKELNDKKRPGVSKVFLIEDPLPKTKEASQRELRIGKLLNLMGK